MIPEDVVKLAAKAWVEAWENHQGDHDADPISVIIRAILTDREALETKLRMIVSHATMGTTDGEGQSVNDICVQITALRNDLYRRALTDREARSVIPAGYKLMPVEPTHHMVRSGSREVSCLSHKGAEACYAAMLDAAPSREETEGENTNTEMPNSAGSQIRATQRCGMDAGSDDRTSPVAPPSTLSPNSAQQAMTDAKIEQWIEACNHEPARETLRHYMALRNQSPTPMGKEPPDPSALLLEAEKALEEAEETFGLVEHKAFPDPAHHDTVKALGRRIGFGALMSTAEAGWREVLQESGVPSGGEFVSGPCRVTVDTCLAKIRSTLSKIRGEA